MEYKMNDEAMRDLVLRHDASIMQQSKAIEHLANVQSELSKELKESNKRLEEISKYLAKQSVFGTRLDDLDRNLTESFKRVHHRIDEVDTIQKSSDGCKSVQLLKKDIDRGLRDLERIEAQVLKNRGDLDIVTNSLNSMVKPATLKWVIGLLILYSVSFGSFMVSSIYELKAFVKQQSVINRTIAEKIIDVRRDFNMKDAK